MAHTPEPWSVDLETGEIMGPGPVVIGTIYEAEDFPCCEEDVDAECKDNARLIAAAPDLLEALQAIVALHNAREASVAPCLLPYKLALAARNAITKALTGEAATCTCAVPMPCVDNLALCSQCRYPIRLSGNKRQA